jgi:predicted PurR-regulated permease PerM
VDTHTPQARIAFAVVLCASLLLVVALAYPLRQPLFLAAVVAASLSGVHEWLARKFGGRRSLAAALLLILLIGLVGVPLTVIASFAVAEGVEGAKWVRESMFEAGAPELISRLPNALAGFVEKLLLLVPSSIEELSGGTGAQAVSAIGGALTATTRLVVYTGVMLLTIFGLLVDGRRLVEWAARISPLSEQATTTLFAEFIKTSRAVLGSTLAVAALQAACAWIGFLIGRVPHATFFGMATFFAAFIPGVGTAIVAVPLAVGMWFTGHQFGAAFVIGWTAVVVVNIDNIVKPLILRGGMRLPAIVVFLSLLGGILMFGPLGILAGPMAIAFFVTIVRLGRRELGAPPAIIGNDGSEAD